MKNETKKTPKSSTYHISLPIKSSEIKKFHVGDLIYLSGLIVSGRDHFHKRVLQHLHNNDPLPHWFQRIHGSALYHMGPIVKQISPGEFQIISGGPTTSARMNQYQTEVAQNLGIRFVIGKGGMDGIAWDQIPAVYLQYPGGAGALVSKFVQEISAVEWLDLGTPEAAWFLQVHEFGPLVVTIDSHGNSLYSSSNPEN